MRFLKLSKICAGVNSQLTIVELANAAGCQRSVLASIHSGSRVLKRREAAVKDLCWRQFTACGRVLRLHLLLSKICAGVNSQPSGCACSARACCQRSVLASIHSPRRGHAGGVQAVKDLCWRQFTAQCSPSRPRSRLSKICAGVNSQHPFCALPRSASCQRSVLASIHSHGQMADMGDPLSKICAGVNSQLERAAAQHRMGCQRSVLASIHSSLPLTNALHRAVKDLCWRQFTAAPHLYTSWKSLSKICAGVNSQLPPFDRHQHRSCQRSVLASIHSRSWWLILLPKAVKDLCWRQFTAVVDERR